MTAESEVNSVLLIPRNYQRYLSKDRLACLVTEDWLTSLRQRKIKELKHAAQFSRSDALLFLAPSYAKLPASWTRVCVKVISKSSDTVDRLHNGSLYNTSPVGDSMEHLVQTARDNFRNMWASANIRLNPEVQETDGTFHTAQEQLTNVVRQYLLRLYPSVYIKLPAEPVENDLDHRNACHHPKQTDHNLLQAHAVIETDYSFFIVQPYVSSTLFDIVSYSPAIFNTSHAKALFVLYQLLHSMLALHSHGLSCGKLSLHNILIDKKLWISVTTPQLHSFRNSGVLSDSSHEETSSTLYISANETLSEDRLRTISGGSEASTVNDDKKSPSHSHVYRISECEKHVDDAKTLINEIEAMSFRIEDLPKLTEEWVTCKLSNFCYLMILNYLAGRRMGDPNHHPILPWVMDFTGPDSGFRDLKQSKFRLNKGDNQLDFTYESMTDISDGSEHIKHHVTDVLSDITYYVYKARKTPKHILCAYVRSKWVPNEYPMSIQRMYQWTPDECIPELFIDPSLFSSIHEDLEDLQYPSWCSSAQDFINKHMAVLESEAVSSNLHHWIDLMFGYKLSGSSAVNAKNVYLHLVDQHTTLTNHGVVQLFNQAHPHRLCVEKTFSILPPRIKRTQVLETEELIDGILRPESAKIKLPQDYDPIAALSHLEALHSFTSVTMEKLPPSTAKDRQTRPKFSDVHSNIRTVWQDMQEFGCLMCELFLASKLHMQNPEASLSERYKMIQQLVAREKGTFPRIIHTAAEVLLQLDSDGEPDNKVQNGTSLLFEYPMVNSLGLPPPSPALLLQPYTNILPFPEYFGELYSVLSQIKEVEQEIITEKEDLTKSKQEKGKIEKVLARKKVELLEKFLKKNYGKISQEGYELILPYIEELFQDQYTTVQAAWSLLNIVGKDLGPQQTAKALLPYLTRLLSGEGTTPKHMKLYHRSFLVQALLRLGLEKFLVHFATLLVEAVAGYKDFVSIEGAPTQEVDEEEEEASVLIGEAEKSYDSVESQDTDQDISDDRLDDIRPDQTEDETMVDDYRSVDTADIDDDFPDLSEDVLGPPRRDGSSDSASADMLSMRSNESDRKDEGHTSQSGTPERASLHSIHSITHIVVASMEANDVLKDGNENLGEVDHAGNGEDIQMVSVHFNLDKENIDNSDSQSKEEEADQSGGDSYKDQSEDQLEDTKETADESESVYEKSPSYMVRSETDDFRQIHYNQTINICDIAAESIKWLSHRLGPLLTAKYLSKNLVRMLALCYLGEEQVTMISDTEQKLPKTTRLIQGDKNAHKVLECLSYVSSLYGEQVILLQYLPCIVDMIQVAKKRLTIRAEAGLVAAVVLLRHVVPLLSDKTIIDVLEESFIKEALRPLLRLVTSVTAQFPSGHSVRSLIMYKLIDVLYILGLRLGFEMTRQHLTNSLQTFFKPFDHVYKDSVVRQLSSHGSSGDLKDNPSTISLKSQETSSIDDYLNIRMDDTLGQYTIGSPVTISIAKTPDSVGSPPQRRWPKTVKSNYSLSAGYLMDEKEEMTDPKTMSEENLHIELLQTFNPELALAAYIPLTSIFGSHHMEEALASDDLIRKLCSQIDRSLYTDNEDIQPSFGSLSTGVDNDASIGSNVEVVGNRLCLQDSQSELASPEQLPKFLQKGILRIDPEETRSSEMERNKLRHLKGNWLAYWEHELGLNERDTMFNFKQIKLQTFMGHTNSIRSITCLDNENSFISASKDKTVKLWSLTSFGDGSGRYKSTGHNLNIDGTTYSSDFELTWCRCQWSYNEHKKSVFSVAYLENMRLVASCDSTVHIWDPFTGDPVQQLESSKYSPVIALATLPSPSTVVVTATTDSTLRFLDLRSASYAHEYKCALSSAGLIRSIAVSPDGSWVAVGFSSGIISLLDLNTGVMLGTWKAHDSEILQLKAYSKTAFLSTSFDMHMKLWNAEEGKEICSFKGHTEPVHQVNFYKSQIVSATTNNKIGVHTSVDQQANFSCTKLRSEVFKGVLTSMTLLPLNRTVLLGADNGLIRLLC